MDGLFFEIPLRHADDFVVDPGIASLEKFH
jgi:hypothetical protein